MILNGWPPPVAVVCSVTGCSLDDQANVLGFRWKDVDLDKRHAVIPASQLNSDAISILRKQLFKYFEFIFTYKE